MKLDALFGAEAVVSLLSVSLALSAVAEQRLDFDDFEKDAPRPWAAEIITGDIAPGLLVPTRKCVCRTDGVLQIGAARECRMPADAKKAFLASGVRVYTLEAQSRIVTEFSARGRSFSVTLSRRPGREDVVCSFEEDGREIAAIALPKGALPADFNFVAGVDGTADMTVKSLSDSQTRNMTKNSRILAGATTMTKSLYLKSDGGTAEATIDNLSTAIVDAERVAKAPPPWTASPDKTFDPVAAGWPLVFSDEFDGVAIDTNKWDLQGNEERKECASLSGDGRLLIKADYRRGSTNQLRTASLWSIPTFRYGYFEARVKFTRESGWWAAFWLCSHGIGNPFLDGFEIDIFEDYYTRIKHPGDGEHPKTLDHNLHVMGAGTMKSRNYNSTLPGSLDDFYVIGCKWTPYEVTIYLNGKAISSKSDHSPYDTVTFDAFRHGACNVPLHVIVSGQIMTKGWRCHDFTGFKIPETYEVDYVRVYGCPDTAEGMCPQVSATTSFGGRMAMPSGETLTLKADVRPAAKTGSPIRAVHLFDDGYHLATCRQPPYEFKVPFTDEWYSRTAWAKPGRSGVVPAFPGSLHAFSIFAEDERGAVSSTRARLLLVRPETESRPYEGKAQKVPGKIVVGRYDEGGQGVGYYDTTGRNASPSVWRAYEGVDGYEHTIGNVCTGEWLRYTVDVAEAGEYQLVFTYGTPDEGNHGVLIACDDDIVGRLKLHPHEYPDWRATTKGAVTVRLPAGRHVLTLLLFGQFNFSDLEFLRIR